MRTIHLVVVASALLLWGCSGAPEPTPQAEAPQPAFKPVGTVMQIMEAVIIPSSNAIWNVPAEAPKNDEEWASVRNSALALAEAGNLLMIGDRAKDQDAWMKAAQTLVAAGTTAFRAAEAKDVDAIMAAGDEIYNSCEGCHMQYPPTTAGEGQ
jgi:cytochrome c556